MKRLLRWTLRGIAGLVVLAVIGAVATLDLVEWRPYPGTPYHERTVRRLEESRAALAPAEDVLSAGFGRARLTPTLGATVDQPLAGKFRAVPLAGYGGRRGRPATGVHDDLHVKAIALRAGGATAVLIGADALIIPAEVTDLAMERIARELGLRRAQIYLSATHTHGSIGGWGEGPVAEAFAGAFVPGVREWFADRIFSAVRDAVADLKPAELGQNRFAAPDFVRNRLVGSLGQTDPEFTFLVVRQRGGRTAVAGSYSAHATVLGSDVMEFHGDYPGYWQRAVEEAIGGLAVFIAGSVGSHGPVSGGKGFAGAERMGRALAAGVVERLAATPLSAQVRLATSAVEVSLPELNARVTDSVRLRPWLAGMLLPVRDECVLQAVRIGGAVWISSAGDCSGDVAVGV
ncbi:MAG: neutral/alkaline non-lysosomal ceramidase N-terminal domain-containing protein, partial [Opitutaceae bacterium]